MKDRKDIYIPFGQNKKIPKSKFTGIVRYKWNTKKSEGFQLYKNGQVYGMGVNFSEPETIIVQSNMGEYAIGFELTIERSKILCFQVLDGDEILEEIRVRNGKYLAGIYVDIVSDDLDYQKLLHNNKDLVAILLKEKEDEGYESAYYDYPGDIVSWGYHYYKKLGFTRTEKEFYDNFFKVIWAMRKQDAKKDEFYEEREEFLHFYTKQKEMQQQIIKQDELPKKINYIAGVDVAYNEMEQIMVGAVVVMDARSLEVVEKAYHKMDITFPYMPGLFSFREMPPILEAYKTLKIKPDLIVCDAQGIAHPKNVGMATHLGIELDIPTIGCAKKRLVGHYDKENLGSKRADKESLIWNNEEVGVALRTQDNIKPMFVSIGHKISLTTAIEWILKLTPKYRLPETTREADQLVNKIIKERTEYDFLNDNGAESR